MSTLVENVSGASVNPLSQKAEPLLEVEDLRVSVNSEGTSFEVVKGVSLSVFENEILCLVGESGCGKSMTALSIMGLLPGGVAKVTEGRVGYEGKDLLGLKNRELRRLRAESISMIFQDPITSLDPVFTIGSVLEEVVRSHRDVSRSAAREIAVNALVEAELPDAANRLDSYPHQLSGGMRQRVMIALAIALDPRLLIADEPTTALDVTVQAQILENLRDRQREREMGMLLITHDLAVVASVADRVAVMYAGEIVEEAPVDELFDKPRHPYTQGLLRALPEISVSRGSLYSIPGRVPPPQIPPPGCLFAPRCEHALDACWEAGPELKRQGLQSLRCFNPQPVEIC
jgi:peptide/nickel transport system ATP-binding protein|tara:strand:- start:703 stop:1737 length:1035 start_codon:yes stop_codon:yes gene_type:complete